MIRASGRGASWATWALFVIVAGARGADQPPNSPVVLDEFDVPNDGDGLWVPVRTGGASRLFIVDTGCAKVVYDESLRSLLGQCRSSENWRTSDANFQVQMFEAPAARLGRLDLFPSPGRNGPLVGRMNLSRFAAVSGVEFRGIVGMSFLMHHVVRLDFDRGKLSFLSAPGAEPGVPLPLKFERGVPHVNVELPTFGKREFKIDTGYIGESGSLDREVVRSMEDRGLVTVLGASLGTDASGITVSRTLQLATIKIGDFEHSNLVFGEHSGGAPSVLGMGYLSRYIVTFDFPRGVMYLKPGKSFS